MPQPRRPLRDVFPWLAMQKDSIQLCSEFSAAVHDQFVQCLTHACCNGPFSQYSPASVLIVAPMHLQTSSMVCFLNCLPDKLSQAQIRYAFAKRAFRPVFSLSIWWFTPFWTGIVPLTSKSRKGMFEEAPAQPMWEGVDGYVAGFCGDGMTQPVGSGMASHNGRWWVKSVRNWMKLIHIDMRVECGIYK